MTAPRGRLRPETLVGVRAVERGMALARSRAGAGDVRLKGARDLVTETDVAVEDAIAAEIAEGHDAPVVGEERGGDGRATGPYWLVDPICGTRNFASAIPLYCVNLALVEDGVVTVAVTGDPPADELCIAERGGGAWVREGDGWRRLGAGDHSQTLAIEDSHANPDPDRRARAAGAVAAAITAFRWDIRAFSTTLALPYVATSRLAAYVLFWTSAVHVAAGSLLAAEAGATVSDIDGGEWTIASDSIVAGANPVLHADLLALAR